MANHAGGGEWLVADVAIVGGGAAGLATAILTARGQPSCRIVVVDRAKRLGAKILISGGGRCNVTNSEVTADDFHGGSRNVIRRVLRAFTVPQTVRFFDELGVRLHEEAGGKLFPNSNRARSVLDALLAEANRLQIRIVCERRVESVSTTTGGFRIRASNVDVHCKRVVVATGGLSIPKTGSDGFGYELARQFGHCVVPTVPALVPLLLDGEFHTTLSGVSHDVALTVRSPSRAAIHQCGPLLWTHFGCSGPVVLNASRHWERARQAEVPVEVAAGLIPNWTFQIADRELLTSSQAHPRQSLCHALSTWLPARVAAAVLHQLGLDGSVPMSQLSRDPRQRLARALVQWPLSVRASRGYGFAEVTAGGVPLEEVGPSTLESRRCPGLYFVGEVLDVDGRIGGFNFQWAWSSAAVVASALSRFG